MNTATQLSVGPSVKWMTVALIGSFPNAGASTLTKSPVAVPTANPDGSFPAAFRYDTYSSLVAKDGRTVSVSSPFAARSGHPLPLWRVA